MQAVQNNKTIVYILGFAGLISAADNWIVSPILPAIAAGFGVTISQAAAVLTAYMIPYGLMQPVYGFLSDCYGKVKILQGVVWGLAFGTMGCYMAGSLGMLCFWRFMTGFFAAGVIAVSLALIGDTISVLERSKYVGLFMGIVFLGQGLSVGLGGIFAKYISWRLAFIFFAGAALCIIFFLRKLPEDFPNPIKRNFFSEVKWVALTSKGRVIFPVALAAGFLLLGLYSYLGSFLHDAIGLDYVEVGVVVMFFGFACLLAGSQVGKYGKNIGQKKVIISGELLAAVASLLLAVFPYWQTGLLATISLGFGYIFIQSTLATIAFDVATERKGLPSALVGVGLFGGGGLGTAFSGLILLQNGYQTLWMVFSAGMLVFIIVTARLHFDWK